MLQNSSENDTTTHHNPKKFHNYQSNNFYSSFYALKLDVEKLLFNKIIFLIYQAEI